MKKTIILLPIFAVLCFIAQCNTDTPAKKTPVDYVNPYMGSINPKTRGVTPVIKVPGGSVGLFPTFTPGIIDQYLADKIFGFPLGFANLMINTGQVTTNVSESASKFDHDMEMVTPYYYQALLEDPDINAEFTITDHSVLFRFTLPENKTSNLLFNLVGNATFEMKDQNIIEGSSVRRVTSRRAPTTENIQYFYIELSKPITLCGTWQDSTIAPSSKSKKGEGIGLYVSYPTTNSEILEIKIGLSDKSVDEARGFVASEVNSMTFDQIKIKAKERWNNELNLIKVKGGTEEQRAIFYSALHRTRSARMGNVWDTYRCAYPLQSLIKPEDTNKAIQGFIKAYEDSGWLTSSGAMVGHHSTAVIVDSYRKGLRDFDIEKAYEGMKKNHMEATMIPWRDEGPITEIEQCYFEKGFAPALPVREEAKVDDPDKWREDQNLRNIIMKDMVYQISWLPEVGVEEWIPQVDPWHRRQSVGITLEHCYDDWCLAQLAKELGKEEDYQLFMKRAHNYQNVFNPAIGMMAPKSADGKWVEPFDPRLSGGFAGEAYFPESNSWIYTWHVQHDVQGLINLMGGRENFIAKLNALFLTQRVMDKLAFLGQFPDMTGVIGMYCQGNEPAFHIPYLYNYAGQPWMTQSRVRQIMDLMYNSTPFGLSGDDDGGSMTSWYVWNAMGLYPQCPGQPIYDIGSPIFDETTINVGHGKSFVITATNVSAKNKYIQSATLNGKPHNKPWINHEDVVKGGNLVLEMGMRPNKNWGSSPDAAAPSMSAPAVN